MFFWSVSLLRQSYLDDLENDGPRQHTSHEALSLLCLLDSFVKLTRCQVRELLEKEVISVPVTSAFLAITSPPCEDARGIAAECRSGLQFPPWVQFVNAQLSRDEKPLCVRHQHQCINTAWPSSLGPTARTR